MSRRGGRNGDGDDAAGEPLADSDLDARVCPTCWRDLPPWQSDCPVCREPAVLRFGFAGAALPAVPDHLRDAIDDQPTDGEGPGRPAEATASAADIATAEAGAHKPDDDPFQDPSTVQSHPAAMIAPPWAAGGPGALGGASGCADGGGAC